MKKIVSLNQLFLFFLKKPAKIIDIEAVQLEFKLLNLDSTSETSVKFRDILGI